MLHLLQMRCVHQMLHLLQMCHVHLLQMRCDLRMKLLLRRCPVLQMLAFQGWIL